MPWLLAGLAVALLALLACAWKKTPAQKLLRRKSTQIDPLYTIAIRNWSLFQESGQIVSHTKYLKTAENRYQLMQRLIDEGAVDVHGADVFLEQARVRVEELRAEKAQRPRKRAPRTS